MNLFFNEQIAIKPVILKKRIFMLGKYRNWVYTPFVFFGIIFLVDAWEYIRRLRGVLKYFDTPKTADSAGWKGCPWVDTTVRFDAWDSACKTPFGAVSTGTEITLRVSVAKTVRPQRVYVILRKDGMNNMTVTEEQFYSNVTDPGSQQKILFSQVSSSFQMKTYEVRFTIEEEGLYFYRFEIETPKETVYVGMGENARAVTGSFLPEWQLLIYRSDFHTPEFLQSGIMYQIFPDRFLRGSKEPLPQTLSPRIIHKDWNERPLYNNDLPNYEATDFFGGDLEGIRQKLPYLRELGVNIIYLNPIFESASNHRYNTANYMAVDPYLGTEEDFKRLCEEAAEAGIRIILDGVFSHTGSDSIYFDKNGHYQGLGAWESSDSPYYSWYTFNDSSSGYDCWWGFPTLPNVNETDPNYLDYICGESGVLRYWMRCGAAGWRLDVADELPDEFLMKLRRSVKGYDPDSLILGEVWEDASNKCSYDVRRPYLQGEELDSVMNYPWMNAILSFVKSGNADAFYTAVMTILDHYPAPSIATLMTPLSTHDTVRAMTALGVEHEVAVTDQPEYRMTEEEYAIAVQRFKLAAALQYTLPGFPSLYYGDEIGMYGFRDPWNRRTFTWDRIDAGLHDYFVKLGKMRREHPEDFMSPLKFFDLDEGVVAYSRGSLLVIVNVSDEDYQWPAMIDSLVFSAGNAAVSESGILVSKKSAAVFKLRKEY